MTRFTAVLVGDQSLLIRCAKMLLDRGHAIAAVVTRNEAVADWAKGQGIALRDLRALDGLAFDWLFSIANLRLIPDAVLALPRQGAINFHDGPLPRYAGLNAPVWAILNGETRHGVTWHMIEGGVDEGDIVASRAVDIAPDETAFTLNAKCYAAAIDSFAGLIAGLAEGDPRRHPQDLSQRSYFARDRRPPNAGLLDFNTTPEEIARLTRALDHGGYRNPLCLPKIVAAGRVFCVTAAVPVPGTGAPGSVLAADAAGLTVATRDGAVRLTALATPDGDPVSGTEVAAAGDVLDPAGTLGGALEALIAAAPGEPFCRRALAAAKPLRLAILGATGEGQLARALRLPAAPLERTAALAAAALLRSAGATDAALAFRADPSPAPGLLSDWAPLSFRGTSFAEAADRFARDLAAARRHPHYPTDLIARDPALEAPAMPDAGLSLTDQPIPGCPLTLCLTPEGAVLKADAARVTPEAFDLIAARIETLTGAEVLDALPLDRLPVLSTTEKEDLFRARNETRWHYDPARTMHAQVEAQADRTPGAIALIFEDARLSHADLEARANRIAHALRARGTRPGQPVGLYCKRGFDLVAGALGILKAGGAYVPMDPAYPADRLAHYLADSGAAVVVTQTDLVASLPDSQAEPLILDGAEIAEAPVTRPEPAATSTDLAYLIYTSGSTGTPKGVMVEHRNTANFFEAMDAHVDRRPGDTWMAVTSLSFDIAVLELFYALSRGFRVVIGGDSGRMPLEGAGASDRPMDFSLFYWGNDDGPGAQKYNLLLEGAKFADAHGFRAVWTPERHFHAFGGPYPNPAVTGAAVAAVTKNLDVRAGSCVAPLHHPARIAEEWAVIDNLTNGRTGIGFASGWQPDDFVLRPENTPPANKSALFEAMDKVRRLWRGEAVEFPKADGTPHAVITQPRPVSKELKVWVTTAGNPDTWREAGQHGANVLTHLLGQTMAEVKDKIVIYRQALAEHGHDPEAHTVTLMLHTYLAEDRETAREVARGPMIDYLRSAAGLIKQYAWAFPAFKKPAGTTSPMQIDLGALDAAEMDAILDFAFQRYFEDAGLFGTIEDGVARVEALKEIGVDEVACLIDYGIAPEVVLEGLKPLAEVLKQANTREEDHSLAAQLVRHKVTHLQCTPSMARMIGYSDKARAALKDLRQVLLGGEALPGALVREVQAATDAQILNMYGPTETTIWSTVGHPDPAEDTANIGRPIANTQVYVLDEHGEPAPIGVAGELFIGGDGVTRGYWNRPELTAERFVTDPATGGRMYRTGDLVRWRMDGALDFLGRIDHQVKLRGHRIELGEIEARLTEVEGVREAVVIPRDETGDTRLVAYVTGTAPEPEVWRAALTRSLPEFMVPAQLVRLDRFPLTPNRKIDRKALPPPPAPVAPRRLIAPRAPSRPAAATPSGAGDGRIEAQVAAVFARLLGVPQVAGSDNFFALGGHSLLAVQAHRELRAQLGAGRIAITDIFRFPTPRGLAAHLAGSGRAREPAAAPAMAAPAVAPTPLSAPLRALPPEIVTIMEARRALRRKRVKEAG